VGGNLAVVPLQTWWGWLLHQQLDASASFLGVHPQPQGKAIAVDDFRTLSTVQLLEDFIQIVWVDFPVLG
jgi:hypothetical protein